MSEKKIAWRRLDGQNAWIGVRGRFRFFTLRVIDRNVLADESAEKLDLTFLLTYHMDNGRPETLNPMKLHEAQEHAERELDEWLHKTGLEEDLQLTPTRHAIDSALGIVEACIEDGIKSLANEYGRQQFAQRIALYSTLVSLRELATIKEGIEKDATPSLLVLKERREQLYEIMTDLKEMI